MPIFVLRLSRLLRSRLVGWRLPLAIAVFVFLTSWGAMWLVEPAESDLTAPANYWWFFVVTAATVGCGDFFPTTPGGRVVGAAGFRYNTFGAAQTHFGQAHRATLLAVRDTESLAVSPAWESPIRKGATLYYVAAQRVDPSVL